MTNWQPMSTAPTDRRFLGADSLGRVWIYQWEAQKDALRPKPYWKIDCTIDRRHWSESFPPLKWMELPKA